MAASPAVTEAPLTLDPVALQRSAYRSQIDTLAHLRRSGDLTAQHTAAVALLNASSLPTIRRHVLRGVPQYKWPSTEITDEHLALYFELGGEVTAVHRELTRRGESPPSVRTLQRAFARELSPAMRADARDGVPGRRAYQVSMTRPDTHRNAYWEGDHVQLDVAVRVPRRKQPVYPWITWWLDDHSRAIMGWSISTIAPTSANVLHALADAIVVDTDRGPFGGAPYTVRMDRGKEFKAAVVKKAMRAFGIVPEYLLPYHPQLKGKIERLNRTVNDEFSRGKPGWRRGAKRSDGKTYRKMPLWTLDRLVAELGGWITQYNCERPHRGLDGRTPLEVFQACDAPLRLHDSTRVRQVAQAYVWRTMQTDGIHFAGLVYWAPEFNGLRGEKFRVGAMPHDRRVIDVFRGNAYLCSAEPVDMASEADREAALRQRAEDADRIKELRAKTRRTSRVRLAPGNDRKPLEEQTVVSIEEAKSSRRGTPNSKALRRAAADDLLGLDTPDSPHSTSDAA